MNTTFPETANAQHWNAGRSDAEGDTSSPSERTADSAAVVVPIKSVLVADRYRKDLGDVSELAASIIEIGLLNPITVTEYYGGYRLVAGERRLRAFEALELAEIPARVARNIVEARDLLVAERDENTQRKEMLPSEAASLGMAIEEMERPAALDRKRAGQEAGRAKRWDGSGSRDPEPSPELRTRDIAAEAIGMKEPTYRRVKQAIATSQDLTETDEVRAIALDVIEQIDAGASIRTQVERIKKAKTVTTEESEVIPIRGTREQQEDKWAQVADFAERRFTSSQIAKTFGMTEAGIKAGAKKYGIEFPADKVMGRARRIDPLEVLERIVASLEADLAVLDLVTYEDVSAETAEELVERLEAPLRAINQMKKKLKEISK